MPEPGYHPHNLTKIKDLGVIQQIKSVPIKSVPRITATDFALDRESFGIDEL